jgi:hypothetical protein
MGAHAEDLPVAGLFNFAQTVQVSTGYLSTWMFGEFTARYPGWGTSYPWAPVIAAQELA